MKIFLFPLIIYIFFASLLHADGCENSFKLIYKKKPHHIYFGPEAFWFDTHFPIKNVKIEDDKFFLGLRLGYEYLKPKAFYAALELFSAGSNKGFRGVYKGHRFPRNKGFTGFGNLELRFGYTFSPYRALLTPFLAIGAYSIGLSRHYGFEESMAYFSGGIRSQYEITPSFNLGANLKILRTSDTIEKFKQGKLRRSKHENMWGGEIGIPFIWHIGRAQRWDIQLEPYFLKLDFSEIQNIYGARLLFGYRL